MTPILSHRLTIPFVLMWSVFVLYSGTFDLGFFSDDFEGIERYQRWGMGGLGDNYGNAFFMPFSFLFQALELQIIEHYTFVKVINLLLFGGTAIFLYHLAHRLFSSQTNARFGALITSLIFICSPYQTEAINWFSSQAYVLATFFSVWALWILLREKQNRRTPVYFNLLLLLALLNKEIALSVPLIVAALYFLQNEKDRSILKISLFGSLVVLLIYFALRWMTLGTLVGGYGNSVHTNFDLGLMLNGVSAYFAKFFGFYRYWPTGVNKIFALSVLILVGITLYIQQKRSANQLRLGLVLLSAFVLSVLPVINLETSFLGNIQSDRYGYFPSVFFSLFAGAILMRLNTALRLSVSTFWILFSITFLVGTQDAWVKAANIRNRFTIALNNQETQDFYLMNVPDNFKGVYIFRHGLEEYVGAEKNVRPLALQHLDGISSVIQWYNSSNKTFGLVSSDRFEVCEPRIGQESSASEGRSFLTIHKDSIGTLPIMFFDLKKGKIQACSME